MKKIIYYLLVFIIALIVIVIFSAPAILLKPQLAKYKNLIQINSLQGKIINGIALDINIKKPLLKQINSKIKFNNLNISKLSWELTGVEFFPLSIAIKLNIKIKDTIIASNIKVTNDGDIYITGLNTDIDITSILSLLQQPKDIVTGNLKITSKSIIISNKQIKDANLVININNFSLFEQKLGNILADINYKKDKKSFLIKIKSLKSKVDITGIISLALDGNYNISMQFSPNKSTNNDIKDMLSLIGTNSGGSRILKLKGILKI